MHSCRLKVQHISNWAISAYNFRTMKDKPHCTTQLFVIEKPLLNTSWSMVQIWISKTMTGHPRVNFVRKIGHGCNLQVKWLSNGFFVGCPRLPLSLIKSIRNSRMDLYMLCIINHGPVLSWRCVDIGHLLIYFKCLNNSLTAISEGKVILDLYNFIVGVHNLLHHVLSTMAFLAFFIWLLAFDFFIDQVDI